MACINKKDAANFLDLLAVMEGSPMVNPLVPIAI
jgi:hypothetical protein